MVGRLNHVGYILPHAQYFLNRLRRLQYRCQQHGPQLINKLEQLDFKLWLDFIEHCSQIGVSFNSIYTVKYDAAIYTDACQHCICGYSPNSGRAWRLLLPPSMSSTLHINILEFIAAYIGIWLELKHTHFTSHASYVSPTTAAQLDGY